jgi:hypothetical protein
MVYMTNAENRDTVTVTGRRGTIALPEAAIAAASGLLVSMTKEDVDDREMAIEVFEAIWKALP